jgi:hypothetical protein
MYHASPSDFVASVAATCYAAYSPTMFCVARVAAAASWLSWPSVDDWRGLATRQT